MSQDVFIQLIGVLFFNLLWILCEEWECVYFSFSFYLCIHLNFRLTNNLMTFFCISLFISIFAWINQFKLEYQLLNKILLWLRKLF